MLLGVINKISGDEVLKINKKLAMEKAPKNTKILPKEREDPILHHVKACHLEATFTQSYWMVEHVSHLGCTDIVEGGVQRNRSGYFECEWITVISS